MPNLTERIKMKQFGYSQDSGPSREELLGRLEIIGDNLMDLAVKQSRIIQNLKEIFKK